MSIVVVNAITVPPEQREEFERRFAGRAGHVSKAEGFEAFELLRPSPGETATGDWTDRYLVYTRWRSREDFEAWMKSAYFAEGHKQHAEKGPAGTGSEVWALELVQSEYA